MKYCTHCGAQMFDEAEICPSCGCRVANQQQTYQNGLFYPNQPIYVQGPESNTIAVLAIIFAFIMPLISFILALVGLSQYKDPINRRKCKIALGIDIGFTILIVLLYVMFIVIVLLLDSSMYYY